MMATSLISATAADRQGALSLMLDATFPLLVTTPRTLVATQAVGEPGGMGYR